MKKTLIIVIILMGLLSSCAKSLPSSSQSLDGDTSEPVQSIMGGETLPSDGLSRDISKSSSANSTTGGMDWGTMGGSQLLLKSPAQGSSEYSLKPLFSWSDIKATSYTFYLEEKNEGSYKQLKEVKAIVATKYQLDINLKASSIYRWRVEAIKDGTTVKHTGSTTGGAVFMIITNANTNKDFAFDGKISEQVLKNYLSRSITLSFLSVPSAQPQSDIRMILNTGAKYIARASLPWEAETNYDTPIAQYKSKIDEIHRIDPDVIFEAGIYETVFKSCEQVPIPEWVFKAYNQTVEKRNFSYAKMIFTNGKYLNQWGEGSSVPDITRIETQMYFYYRACRYIDAGFEGIHWGQVMLIGENDAGNKDYSKLLTMIRQYAAVNARRHFVLNNAATHGSIGPDGVLLYDFHIYPSRVKPLSGEQTHAPSESNPQKAGFEVNYIDSIYNKSLGGKTVSGWTCSSLPFIVDLDNYGGFEKGYLHNPGRAYWPWGMDEISWFVNQPASYRATWLHYAYQWIRDTDPAGFLCMPGSRCYYSLEKKEIVWYYANSTEFSTDGFNDENVIKAVWSK